MDALPRNYSSRGPSLYTLLAELPLEIDVYHTERKELDVSSGFLRVTTTVVLRGGGHEGRGEDVTYAAEDHDPYPLALPLAGDWTLDGLSERLGGLDLFPDRPPQMEFFRPYRRWAFESAALDLALRQQGQVQRGALERPAPVRPEDLHLRRPVGEQVQAAEPFREPVQRPVSRERERQRVRVVILGRVGHVFPAPLVPAAAQHDSRGHAQEAAGDAQLRALCVVDVDLEGKLSKQSVQTGPPGGIIAR